MLSLSFLVFFFATILECTSAQSPGPAAWTRVNTVPPVDGWFPTTSFDGKRMAVAEPSPSCYTDKKSCFFVVKAYQIPDGGSQWVQMGAEISKVTNNDTWGYSSIISGDGRRLVVGNAAASLESGAVSVYEWNDSTSLWVKKGQDLSVMVRYKDIPMSPSISYDGMLVSFSVELSGKTGYGGVRVYRWMGDTLGWVKVGQSVQQVPFDPKFKNKGAVSQISRDGKHVAVLNIKRDDGQPGNGEEIAAGIEMATVCSVFWWDEESNAWFQMGRSFQVSSNREHQRDFKIVVSDNGLVVAVHAFEPNYVTRVSVFEFVQGSWSRRGNPVPKSFSGHAFAFDLSGDGNLLVCGNFSQSPDNPYCSVIYKWYPSESIWDVVGKTPCPQTTDFLYGTLSLSISGDGSVVTESFMAPQGIILSTYTSGEPLGSPERPFFTTPPPPPSTTPATEPSVSLEYTLKMSGVGLADFDEDNVIRMKMGIARTAGVKMKQVDTTLSTLQATTELTTMQAMAKSVTQLFKPTPSPARRLLQAVEGVVANVIIHATSRQSQTVQVLFFLSAFPFCSRWHFIFLLNTTPPAVKHGHHQHQLQHDRCWAP